MNIDETIRATQKHVIDAQMKKIKRDMWTSSWIYFCNFLAMCFLAYADYKVIAIVFCITTMIWGYMVGTLHKRLKQWKKTEKVWHDYVETVKEPEWHSDLGEQHVDGDGCFGEANG